MRRQSLALSTAVTLAVALLSPAVLTSGPATAETINSIVISAGGDTTCAIVKPNGQVPNGSAPNSGSAWCWGAHRGYGLGLGSGTYAPPGAGTNAVLTRVLLPTPVAQPADTNVTSLSVGYEGACALGTITPPNPQGPNPQGLWCWGTMPTQNWTNVPARPDGGSSSAISYDWGPGPTRSVATSGRDWAIRGNLLCAVDSKGAARCTNGPFGSLWSGTQVVNSTDVTDFQHVVVGNSHACGTDGSAVACWGRNDIGQVSATGAVWYATNDAQTVTLPTGVVSQLAASGDVTCAVVNGDVWCWGANDTGQLGDVSPSLPKDGAHPAPVQVTLPGADADSVTAISVGPSHVCAVAKQGGNRWVWCWGKNSSNQVTAGAQYSSWQRPYKVPGSKSAQAVATGDSHSCATFPSGNYIRCWGSNAMGQLGDGSLTDTTSGTLALVPNLPIKAAKITAGNEEVVCILSTRNDVFCAGDGSDPWGGDVGASGAGQYVGETPARAQLPRGKTVLSLDAGRSHVCAVVQGIVAVDPRGTGRVFCWGSNSRGQLGRDTGATNRDHTPAEVQYNGAKLGPARSVSAGGDSTCAVMANHEVVCWGSNSDSGKLGTNDCLDGNTTFTRVQSGAGIAYCSAPLSSMGSLTGVSSVSVGLDSACALTLSGSVYCWGSNYGGAIGVGVDPRWLPDHRMPAALPVQGLPPGVSQITTGDGRGLSNYTCALQGGQVYCWGAGGAGTFGQSPAGFFTRAVGIPITVWSPLGRPVRALVAGTAVSDMCALTAGPGGPLTIKCAGASFGAPPLTPTGLGSGFMNSPDALAVGPNYVCGIRTDNQVSCSGSNAMGRVQSGNTSGSFWLGPLWQLTHRP